MNLPAAGTSPFKMSARIGGNGVGVGRGVGEPGTCDFVDGFDGFFLESRPGERDAALTWSAANWLAATPKAKTLIINTRVPIRYDELRVAENLIVAALRGVIIRAVLLRSQ
jgi:hypothetical protein